MKEKLNRLIECLRERSFMPYYADNKAEAIEIIDKIIKKGSTIGFGGSITVEELDLPKHLLEKGHNVLHYTINKEYDYPTLSQMAKDADYMITSTNALTEEGELVNIDGRSNRIANLVYGPSRIIVVLGVNKIVKDLNSAITRIRNVAAPLNAKRLKKNTPCVKNGLCSYCSPPDSICRNTLIQHFPSSNTEEYNIVIVNEKLGY